MLKTLPALAALAVAGALVVPTVSLAAETNSIRVSYADLNLATNPGQHRLERRVAEAARFVCVIEDSRELALSVATKDCRTTAINDARPQMAAAINAARRGTVTVLEGAALIVTAR
jgi:UrcA family protein